MGTLQRNVTRPQTKQSYKTSGCAHRACDNALTEEELKGNNPLDYKFVSGAKGTKQTRLTTKGKSFKQNRRAELKASKGKGH
jgi:hypothetical protein